MNVGVLRLMYFLRVEPSADLFWGAPPILHWSILMKLVLLRAAWLSLFLTKLAGLLCIAKGAIPILVTLPSWDQEWLPRPPFPSKCGPKHLPQGRIRLTWISYRTARSSRGSPFTNPTLDPWRRSRIVSRPTSDLNKTRSILNLSPWGVSQGDTTSSRSGSINFGFSRCMFATHSFTSTS